MSETQSCCNMDMCKTARLWQENSALRAVVEEQEKELSLLREAVGHCYGIVTEPRVLFEEEMMEQYATAILFDEPQSLIAEASSAENMREELELYRKTYGIGYPPNCT